MVVGGWWLVVGGWWLGVSSRTLASASSGGGGVGDRDVGRSVDDGSGGASAGGGGAGGGAGRTVQAICPAIFGTFPSSLASSSISLAICSLGPRPPTQRRPCSDVPPVGRTSQHLGFRTPRRRGLNATAGLCGLAATSERLAVLSHWPAHAPSIGGDGGVAVASDRTRGFPVVGTARRECTRR